MLYSSPSLLFRDMRRAIRQSLGVCLKLVLLLFENSFVSLNLFTVLMHL